MKRAAIIVLDSVGIGELPDAAKYGDQGSNTLVNIKKNYPVSILFYYSTVTDLAKFLGLSTSNPLSFEI